MAGKLLFLDDLLDAFQLLADVWGELVHFEGGDYKGFVDAFDFEFVELQHVDEVVFEFVLSGLGVGFIPSQLHTRFLFLLVNPLLECLGVLWIYNHFFRRESGQMIAFRLISLNDFLKHSLKFFDFLVLPAFDLLSITQLHILLGLQFFILQTVD